jgi:hypothetical protein
VLFSIFFKTGLHGARAPFVQSPHIWVILSHIFGKGFLFGVQNKSRNSFVNANFFVFAGWLSIFRHADFHVANRTLFSYQYWSNTQITTSKFLINYQLAKYLKHVFGHKTSVPWVTTKSLLLKKKEGVPFSTPSRSVGLFWSSYISIGFYRPMRPVRDRPVLDAISSTLPSPSLAAPSLRHQSAALGSPSTRRSRNWPRSLPPPGRVPDRPTQIHAFLYLRPDGRTLISPWLHPQFLNLRRRFLALSLCGTAATGGSWHHSSAPFPGRTTRQGRRQGGASRG